MPFLTSMMQRMITFFDGYLYKNKWAVIASSFQILFCFDISSIMRIRQILTWYGRFYMTLFIKNFSDSIHNYTGLRRCYKFTLFWVWHGYICTSHTYHRGIKHVKSRTFHNLCTYFSSNTVLRPTSYNWMIMTITIW